MKSSLQVQCFAREFAAFWSKNVRSARLFPFKPYAAFETYNNAGTRRVNEKQISHADVFVTESGVIPYELLLLLLLKFHTLPTVSAWIAAETSSRIQKSPAVVSHSSAQKRRLTGAMPSYLFSGHSSVAAWLEYSCVPSVSRQQDWKKKQDARY
jgi:hypothetical protein